MVNIVMDNVLFLGAYGLRMPEVVVYDAVGRRMETGFAGGVAAYHVKKRVSLVGRPSLVVAGWEVSQAGRLRTSSRFPLRVSTW